MRAFFNRWLTLVVIASVIFGLLHHPLHSASIKSLRGCEVAVHFLFFWLMVKKLAGIFPKAAGTPQYSDDGTLSLSDAGVKQAEESLVTSPDWPQARIFAALLFLYIAFWVCVYWVN
jgi:hypothetical protein